MNKKRVLPKLETTEETQSKTLLDKKELTEAHAKSVFQLYAAQLEKDKRGSLAAFFRDPLLQLKESTLTFTVGSKLVETEIINERQKIKDFFTAQGYELLELVCKVNAKEISEYKVFTPKQQFDVMVKDIPILEDFANRFNLEIE